MYTFSRANINFKLACLFNLWTGLHLGWSNFKTNTWSLKREFSDHYSHPPKSLSSFKFIGFRTTKSLLLYSEITKIQFQQWSFITTRIFYYNAFKTRTCFNKNTSKRTRNFKTVSTSRSWLNSIYFSPQSSRTYRQQLPPRQAKSGSTLIQLQLQPNSFDACLHSLFATCWQPLRKNCGFYW